MTIADSRIDVSGLGTGSDELERAAQIYSPLLEARARHQLGGHLRHYYDPKDIVNTVWERALPKITGAGERIRDPLRFLNKIQTDLVNEILRRFFRERPLPRTDGDSADPLLVLSSGSTSLFSRVARNDDYERALAAFDTLDETDRTIVVERALLGAPYREIGHLVGMRENAVTQRYRRALAGLRDRLPSDVYEVVSTPRS